MDWLNFDVFGVVDDFNGFVDIKIVWVEECCGGFVSIVLSLLVLLSGLNELLVFNFEVLEIVSLGLLVLVFILFIVFLLGLGVLFIGIRKFCV